VTLLALANLLQLCTAVTAVALAWKRRSYWPAALLFVVIMAADWSRLVLDKGILSTAPRPREGLARLAFHLEQALFLTWPAGLTALAGWVFRGRRPWGVALAYSAVLVSLAISYPQVRQNPLERAYLVIHLLAFGYASACIARQLFKATPEVEQIVVVFSTVISLVALLGPPCLAAYSRAPHRGRTR